MSNADHLITRAYSAIQKCIDGQLGPPDYEVVVEAQSFDVHTAVLANGSDVLQAMFNADMIETQEGWANLEVVGGVPVGALLICWLYEHAIPNDLQPAVLVGALVTAEKFLLDDMVREVEAQIHWKLNTPSNCAEFLDASVEYGSEDIMQRVVDYLTSQFYVLQGNEWDDIAPELFAELIWPNRVGTGNPWPAITSFCMRNEDPAHAEQVFQTVNTPVEQAETSELAVCVNHAILLGCSPKTIDMLLSTLASMLARTPESELDEMIEVARALDFDAIDKMFELAPFPPLKQLAIVQDIADSTNDSNWKEKASKLLSKLSVKDMKLEDLDGLLAFAHTLHDCPFKAIATGAVQLLQTLVTAVSTEDTSIINLSSNSPMIRNLCSRVSEWNVREQHLKDIAVQYKTKAAKFEDAALKMKAKVEQVLSEELVDRKEVIALQDKLSQTQDLLGEARNKISDLTESESELKNRAYALEGKLNTAMATIARYNYKERQKGSTEVPEALGNLDLNVNQKPKKSNLGMNDIPTTDNTAQKPSKPSLPLRAKLSPRRHTKVINLHTSPRKEHEGKPSGVPVHPCYLPSEEDLSSPPQNYDLQYNQAHRTPLADNYDNLYKSNQPGYAEEFVPSDVQPPPLYNYPVQNTGGMPDTGYYQPVSGTGYAGYSQEQIDRFYSLLKKATEGNRSHTKPVVGKSPAMQEYTQKCDKIKQGALTRQSKEPPAKSGLHYTPPTAAKNLRQQNLQSNKHRYW